MRLIAVPIAVLLFAYLPGHATARWYRARTGRPFAAGALWPFPEILLGLCLLSTVAFALAEWGHFSLPALALILGLYSGLLLVLGAGGTATPASGRRTPALVAAAAIALVVGAFYTPPYDTSLVASDATFYVSLGQHIARHGSILVPDPLVGALGSFERMWLLLRDDSGAWSRMVGGALISSGGSEAMWPTFSHMLPVWIAIFYGFGGPEACGLVATTFAGLSLWAIFLVASELRGIAPAVVATALVATNVTEVYYGRFLMPEIVAQFFLWGGFLAFVVWWRRDEPSAGVLAALALGVTGLTRIEYLFFLPLVLLLQLTLAPRRPRGLVIFLGVYAALVAHAVAHLFVAPSHYRETILSELTALWTSLEALGPTAVVGAVLGLVILAAMGFTLGRGRRSLRVSRGAALVVAVAFLGAFVARSHALAAASVTWLAAALPWPTIAVAVVGVVVWLRDARREDGSTWLPLVAFAIVGSALLYDPHARPFQLWATRRFVPVVIPFLCLAAATGLEWIARTVRPRAATTLCLGLGVLVLVPGLRPTLQVARLPIYPDQRRPLQWLADRMPEGAVVLIAPSLERCGFHRALWLAHDRETFVLRPFGEAMAVGAVAPAILRQQRALYYLAPGDGHPPGVRGLAFTPVEEMVFRFVLPAGDNHRAPERSWKWGQQVRLYQVTAPPP